MDALTFGLAYLAYILLCADVVLHAGKKPRRPLTIALAAVLTAHVALVWGHRFGWSFDTALEKGIAPMVVFHAAFFAIVSSAFVKEPWAGRVLYGSSILVSLAAIPAPFRYEFIAWLRIPMIVAPVITLALILQACQKPPPTSS